MLHHNMESLDSENVDRYYNIFLRFESHGKRDDSLFTVKNSFVNSADRKITLKADERPDCTPKRARPIKPVTA